MKHKAQIGSISTGTLRTEDLIEAFSSELMVIAPDDVVTKRIDAECQRWLDAHEDQDDADDSAGAELVHDLEDMLDQYAPPYCYFGSLEGEGEGDGANFGFWPCMDEVNELPRVADGDEAKELGEDCIFVNDHGNVTVFDGDGSVIWDCV